jgi:predicted nucleic acid-binding protein
MMNKKYVLDTNIITYLYQKNSLFHSFATEKLMDISHDDKVYISILSIYEYEYGVSFADDMILEELKKAKNTFLELFQVLPLSMKGAEIFGGIKSLYRKETGISPKALERHNTDLMLASSAIAENAILVSNDHIFEQLKELYPDFLFENWTVA